MCSCGPEQYTPREARHRAEAVFLGRVTAVLEHPQPSIDTPRTDASRRAYTHWAFFERFHITLEVQRVWKGKIGTTVDVVTGTPAGACGVAFELGKDYLVYLDRELPGHSYTSVCARTRLAANAARDFAELGRGVAPVGTLAPARPRARAPARPPHN